MNSSAHRKELGQFLKARRAELSPHGRSARNRPAQARGGLRRDEVAVLAAISTRYYTGLEQGRMTPSASVLSELVRALHLSDDQRDRLFELAGRRPAGRGGVLRRRRTPGCIPC